MSLKPLRDMILIAEFKKEAVTDSGIIIQGARGVGDTTPGKVVAIGSEVTDIVVGDTVYLDWSKCSAVTVDGEQRAMVKQEHIIAVVDA